ncbi:MAG: phage tail tape measure protein, partial [Mycobacterium sp.]|nr:phage tail tape measure protein [Mycobacterium sp.]
NVLKAAAQGAKSENAELGEVLSGLTTSMNDFGYGPASAADVMSKMVAATGMAKTNFQEFSGALHSVEPIAAAVGQNLDAAGKQHLMADVYGSLAQVTQSGTSPDQAAQNMARAFTSLANPTQQMRDEMGQFGLNAEEVSQKLGERGLSGTMQYLSDTIRQHMSPQGQVVVDTMYKSAQASDAADKIFKSLPPEAQKVAQSIKDGTLSYKEFRKTRGGLDVEQANELQQWVSLNNRITGYSNALKSGQGDVQTYMQALRLMLGNQESARIAVQLTGENTDATNQKVKAIDQTTREHDGTVKGFNETQETLNAKLADAKAAFGAAAIEMGTVFVPAATKVAEVAKWIGDEMAKHPGIMHTVIDVLGTLGGAWLGIKALNIADTVLMPITRGLVGVVAGEEAATAAAGGLSGALRGLAGAVPYVAAAYAGIEATNAATGNRSNVDNRQNPNGWWGTGFGVLGGPLKGLFGRAGGGPLSAPGPKGKDSALFWGADGEHVLTHDDVQAMGGHSGVYAFRNALHREGGGAVGPDVYAAHSMAGTKYSQGNRDDCSGMVGRVVGSALGIPNAGLPTTQNMGSWLEALGFKRGVGGPGTISVGWYNHGSSPNDGHAAMTLSDGENAESGGSHGDFRVGSGAAGANSPQFDQHMYLPNLYGQGAASGGAGGFSPFGGGAGGGFGGGSPEKVAAAQETVRHLDAEIANAEQRKSELKDDAKQSQRDRLDEEIRHLHIERDQAQERLQKAEQGTFHRGGAGMGLGGIQFGAPLAEG